MRYLIFEVREADNSVFPPTKMSKSNIMDWAVGGFPLQEERPAPGETIGSAVSFI